MVAAEMKFIVAHVVLRACLQLPRHLAQPCAATPQYKWVQKSIKLALTETRPHFYKTRLTVEEI